jgi:hypothetical protein
MQCYYCTAVQPAKPTPTDRQVSYKCNCCSFARRSAVWQSILLLCESLNVPLGPHHGQATCPADGSACSATTALLLSLPNPHQLIGRVLYLVWIVLQAAVFCKLGCAVLRNVCFVCIRPKACAQYTQCAHSRARQQGTAGRIDLT